LFTAQRSFGPKPKAAGGPPAAEYKPVPVVKTNFEFMIEKDGIDQFLFGPPSGVEKVHNAHRDYVSPKVASRMEFVAKKMREQYIREGIWPTSKIFLDPLRNRAPDDTLQNCHAKQEVAAVIQGREEFDDMDLVFPNRTPFTI
jgi:hypothetical protein